MIEDGCNMHTVLCKNFLFRGIHTCSKACSSMTRLWGLGACSLPTPTKNILSSHALVFILGSEYRNWLLFYSLPVLKGILPNPYLTHFSYLVMGVWILSANEVSQENLSHARVLLNKFYQKFHELMVSLCTLYVCNAVVHV